MSTKWGTGACLPWCSISSSFQNSLKTSGHRGYEFLEFVLEFGPILVWYRFPAAEEFVVVFDVFLPPGLFYYEAMLL